MVRIIQITDIHLDLDDVPRERPDAWEQFRWALERSQRENPDLIVITGDVGKEMGTPPLYRTVASILADMDVDVILLPGNHDRREDFFGAFGRRYRLSPESPTLDRVIETGGRPMLALDTADGFLHDHTLAWFDMQLNTYAAAARGGMHAGTVVVWMHHPPITGFHRFMDANYALSNGDDFLTIADRYHGNLTVSVFCGHYHTEYVATAGAVTQYVTPSTWYQIDPVAEECTAASTVPAFRVVDFDEYGGVTTSVITGDE